MLKENLLILGLSMRRRLYVILVFLLLPLSIHGEEDYIHIGSFLTERTKQYPLPNNQRIILVTPPRCGSTLIYNVLRFLFEKEGIHFLWEDPYQNLVVKDHVVSVIDSNSNYILAIRNPVEIMLSWYRISCDSYGRVLETTWFPYHIDLLLTLLMSLEELRTKTDHVMLLRYEDFSNNLDALFLALEKNYSMEIDPRDKAFLKRALSKGNVIKNAAKYPTFSEYDPYSHFHGNHIDQGDFAPSYYKFLRNEIQDLLLPHAEIFMKWGYNLSITNWDIVEADDQSRKIGPIICH